MEDTKNLPSDKLIPPYIMSLKELYELNIIYVMFILNGNRTQASKALNMSVRSLRDNLKVIEKKKKIQFPTGGTNYKASYLRYNHKELDEASFIQKTNPVKYIKKLQLFVSQFGFPYVEVKENTHH
jgi:hypothetical protein